MLDGNILILMHGTKSRKDVDIYRDEFYCFTLRRQLCEKKIPKSVFEVIDIHWNLIE
jgi:hypothetical protein